MTANYTARTGRMLRSIAGALLVLALTAAHAHAEVMDKEPTALQNWAWAVLGGGFAVVAWRWRWWLGVPVSVVAMLYAFGVHEEITDPFIGPAIVAEAGPSYVNQFYWSALAGFVLHAIAIYSAVKKVGPKSINWSRQSDLNR